MDHTKWMKPIEVCDIDIVCGAKALGLLPPYEEIPEDFKRVRGREDAEKWVDIVDDWFFNGAKSVRFITKSKDIDQRIAIRHLSAIMHSFEPQHEHKTAGVAYLMSLWFDDVTYDKVK